MSARCFGFLIVFSCALAATSVEARSLSFEDRVRAQEAIERVYHAHQIGPQEPFELALPRAALEAKVRRYLKQSAALEEIWGTPVTGEMLERELARMARDSRLPERLRELYAALDDDPSLVLECLARPALVDRLTRSFFAFDDRMQGEARDEARRLRDAVVTGEVDPYRKNLRRTLVELVPERAPGEDDELREASGVRRVRLARDAWSRRIGALPGTDGAASAVREGRDALSFEVVLSRERERVELATFSVEKRSWDDWWTEVEGELDERSVRAVATGATLPVPGDAEATAGAPCSAQDRWVNGSLDDAPEARSLQTAVWTGSVVIVWGGIGESYLNSGGRYDPATDTWSPVSASGAPSARVQHTAVWSGSRMVVWGGYVYADGRDVYLASGGRYDPVSDTWAPVATSGAPAARAQHSAVAIGSRMLVWGGRGAALLDSGASYDPVADAWTAIATANAPAPRAGHTAVWTGSQLVVWGGRGTSGLLGTGGRYDPAADTWVATSTAGGPSAREGHTAVWTGSRMLVWAGAQAGGYALVGGRYDPVTDAWTAIATSGQPSPRSLHSAVWTGTRMVVWGGSFFDGRDHALASGGRYDPQTDTWSATATASAPSARMRHSALWTGTRMVVWGGSGDRILPSSGGRYDPATDTWTATAATRSPAGRSSHAAVWTGSLMLVWGGGVDDGAGGDTATGGRYDPATDTWTATATSNAPSARHEHAAVWTGSRMLVWGGVAGDPSAPPLASGARYHPATDTWTPIAATGAPIARRFDSAVWTGSELVIWGGRDTAGTFLANGARYDPAGDFWTPTSSVGAPAARAAHAAAWAGSRMVVWGGMNAAGALGTGGRYDPGTNTWSPTSSVNAPPARYRAVAVAAGTRVLVWGGSNGTRTNTGGLYDPASDVWTPTSTSGAPAGRIEHTGIWTGDRLVVWGGSDRSHLLQTGGRYDPATDSWAPTSTVSAPSPRALHTAVWTGSTMLVWGGYPARDSGGAYDPGCVAAPPAWHVDFGPAGTPPETGYARDAGLAFDPASGTGWLVPASSPLSTRARSCSGIPARRSTFAYSTVERTFEIAVANGEHDVTISVGDCQFSQGPQRVSVEGVRLVDDETTGAGQFLVRTRRVRVLDGRLSVTIGGSAGTTALNSIDVGRASDQPARSFSFNFQDAGAPTPSGFTADLGAPFDAAQGRGWSRDLQAATVHRGVNADLALDSVVLVGAEPASFEVAVPAGTYDVKVSVGDSIPGGPHRVVVEGVTLFDGETTAAGAFLARSTRVYVSDGRLTVDVGGTSGTTGLNYLTLVSGRETSLRVNFQPETSVIPRGYSADSGAPYDPGRGFGWQQSLLGQTRDRHTGVDPRLDTLLYVGATARTWEAEVPFGEYDVRLTVGDAAFAQGPHLVSVEGRSLFSGETTAAGAFLTRTIRVPVRDGRLSVSVGGGATGMTTIDYLDVGAAESLVAVNFQPASVEVPAGYSADTGATYTSSRGYGWSADASTRTRVRGLVADRSLDSLLYTGSPAATWKLDLPAGDYQVSIAVGDAAFAQGPQRVVAEGVLLVNGESTPARGFLKRSACVSVADGQLTLDVGGLAGNTALDWVRVTSSRCGGSTTLGVGSPPDQLPRRSRPIRSR